MLLARRSYLFLWDGEVCRTKPFATNFRFWVIRNRSLPLFSNNPLEFSGKRQQNSRKLKLKIFVDSGPNFSKIELLVAEIQSPKLEHLVLKRCFWLLTFVSNCISEYRNWGKPPSSLVIMYFFDNFFRFPVLIISLGIYRGTAVEEFYPIFFSDYYFFQKKN